MHKSLLSASLFALALAAPIAHAHEAGDILVRAGAITVNPKADSGSVKVDQGPLAGTNLGGKATMSSDTQLGLNFAYMLTNHVGIELLAATPFEHDVKIKNTALGAANGKLGHPQAPAANPERGVLPAGQQVAVPALHRCRYQLHLDL
jgi:outer membrane protein